MKAQLKVRWEAMLIRLAAWILRGRNVTRAMVVSRKDNNVMFEMGYELDGIAERIENGYEGETKNHANPA